MDQAANDAVGSAILPEAASPVAAALPAWLGIATRWADTPVFLWRPGAEIPGSSLLRFVDDAGALIDTARASELLVDRGVFLPTVPRGTRRIEIIGTAPAEGPAVRFFPASRPLVRLLDPFGLRARTDASPPESARRLFRQRWKTVARRPEGALYRAWSARFVGDFATVRPSAATGPINFVLADRQQAATPRESALLADALAAQTDQEWRLVIPVASGQYPAVPKPAASDRRWQHIVTGATGFAATVNAALAAIDSDHVVLLRPGVLPTPDAVAILRDCFTDEPDVRFAYTDEERLDSRGTPQQGLFKPAFSPRLLEACDYVGDIAVYRRADILSAGGLDDAAAEPFHELMTRVTGSLHEASIRHIPRVACRSARPAGAAAIARSAPARTTPTRTRLPRVSIVMPTRDRADLLKVALDSLIDRTDYPDFEIVAVDNGSAEPAALALLAQLGERRPGSRVIRDDAVFNFSRLANAGIAAARGEMICLLNNDVEIIERGWLAEMVDAAAPPTVGIVGARLLFPSGRIQHAGIVVGLSGGCTHWFSGAPGERAGPWDRLLFPQNVSAVTGACLLVKRQCLETVGVLNDTDLAVEYNDVDLCLRTRRAGFEVVWTPRATLIHHESASRAGTASPEATARLERERDYMRRRWDIYGFEDPYYNPNLARDSLTAQLAFPPRERKPRSSLMAARFLTE